MVLSLKDNKIIWAFSNQRLHTKYQSEMERNIQCADNTVLSVVDSSVDSLHVYIVVFALLIILLGKENLKRSFSVKNSR